MWMGFHSLLQALLISLVLFVQTEGLFHIFIKPECLETGMQDLRVQEDLKGEPGDVMNGNHTGRWKAEDLHPNRPSCSVWLDSDKAGPCSPPWPQLCSLAAVVQANPPLFPVFSHRPSGRKLPTHDALPFLLAWSPFWFWFLPLNLGCRILSRKGDFSSPDLSKSSLTSDFWSDSPECTW